MYLANLGLGALAGIFILLGAVITILYLRDRSRRDHTVPTLRFWRQFDAARHTTRWRITEPWSLLLQLAGLLLLLLAIGDLHLGTPSAAGRDHVLILDTSAWMEAMTPAGSLMDEARRKSAEYVRALPAGDRVMVVRADAVATAATAFEADRGIAERAIAESVPGSTALQLGPAIAFARQTLRLHSRRPGEIAIATAGRIADQTDAALAQQAEGLRILPLSESGNNIGIRRVGLRHSAVEPDLWEVLAVLHNYGDAAVEADLAMQFAGAPSGFERLRLAPGVEHEHTFPLRTRAAGPLEIGLFPEDSLPSDNYATLQVPARREVRLAVYSGRPERWRTLVAALPMVDAEFRTAGAGGDADCDIMIIDGVAPTAALPGNVIWVVPPPGSSPVPVERTVSDTTVERWLGDHVLSAGLRNQQVRLPRAQILAPAGDDLVIARSGAGPVAVARASREPDGGRTVVLGFHPEPQELRADLSAPVLFANIIRWMEPNVFRQWELTARGLGVVSVELPEGADPDDAEVTTEAGQTIPYAGDAGRLRFFAAEAETVTVRVAGWERLYSFSLPELPARRWQPPAGVRRGVPATTPAGTASRSIWLWLAILGLTLLLIEWVFWGDRRYRAPAAGVASPSRPRAMRKAS